ncbi:MAG: DUF4202 domain-containing protein [Pseudomonadota bacterium]
MGTRLEEALERIDAAHAEDPEKDASGTPQELAYARRMSAWLERLAPAASEPLRLAIRCQHLKRWMIRRADYPAGAEGYRRWRSAEADAHSKLAGEILTGAGYEAQTVERVKALIRKENLKRDPEAQLVEDAACLVFLENYFAAFAPKHDEATLVRILRKTWAKMSAKGRDAALALELPAPLRALVEKALAK